MNKPDTLNNLLNSSTNQGLSIITILVSLMLLTIGMIILLRKKATIAVLQYERDFLNSIISELSDGIIIFNLKGKITLLNKASKYLFDISTVSLEHANKKMTAAFYYIDGCTPVSYKRNPIHRVLAKEEVYNEGYIISPNPMLHHSVTIYGQLTRNSKGRVIGGALVVRDITNRKKMESQLIKQATHDNLTQLPNRALLIDRLNRACTHSRRNKTNLAIIFLDIDLFKNINDRFGHQVGDIVLQEVSKRLRGLVRASDSLARIGGDEFIVILTDLSGRDKIIAVSNKILTNLATPYHLNDHVLNLTVSMGISVYPQDGADEEILLRHADTAMYLAKEKGRNNFQFYSKLD